MKYAIYGAGSLGTVLGAYITKAGIPVELVNRNRAHVEALRKNGAHIKGKIEMNVPVHAIYPDEMEGPYDVIFLMTKQQQNREVVSGLCPLLSGNGVIVTLQNGLPEPLIAEIAGWEHTLGCVVEWGATLSAPGECILTSDVSRLAFRMGRTEGISEEQFRLVKELLEKMCPVYTEDNPLGVRWRKLLINSVFSGLGTALGGVYADVSESDDARPVAVRCIKECLDVAEASGVELVSVEGRDFRKLFYYTNEEEKAAAIERLPEFMEKYRLIEPSMLQDLKKGKICEVDAINETVCVFGRKYGVPTPVNDRIAEVIRKEQSGELPLAHSNIAFFADLV